MNSKIQFQKLFFNCSILLTFLFIQFQLRNYLLLIKVKMKCLQQVSNKQSNLPPSVGVVVVAPNKVLFSFAPNKLVFVVAAELNKVLGEPNNPPPLTAP